MRQIISFNNKNWPLPGTYIPPYTLPFGMKVYDGDINVQFEYSYSNTIIYYVINNTSNWNILGNQTITVNNGDTIYFYGPLNNKLNDGGVTRGFHTSGTGKIDLVGNLLSLCNPNWTSAINITSSNFSSMFRECKNNLYNANNSYIRTNNIRTGIDAGYGYLFFNCNNLKTPVNWICENNSLTISGSIATFIGMYAKCTSLQSVIIPPIIGMAPKRILERYVDGCTSLNKMYYNGTLSINYVNFSRNTPTTGDFYNLGGATYTTGTSGIPSGWTIHTSL